MTSTVSPATTFVAAAAAAIVQNGCPDVPALGPLLLQLEFVLSTVHVVDAWAAAPPVSRPATRTAPIRPDQLAARSRLPGIRQPSREPETEHGNPSPKNRAEPTGRSYRAAGSRRRRSGQAQAQTIDAWYCRLYYLHATCVEYS